MRFRAKQIAPPKQWTDFEDLCHAIFKKQWNDLTAQKNGRSGQKQHGVDVFGSPDGDRSKYHGVQCKGKEANYGSEADFSEVTDEIAKADEFDPPLEHWIFATTAPVDANLQKEARLLSKQRKANGKFSVDVLGWDEILALMANAPEVIKEFYPEHSDHIPEVLEALRGLPSIEEKLEGLAEQLTDLGAKRLPARWEKISFESDRGLGPALLGRSLGPADAAACPRLAEVDTVLSNIHIGYSARITGEPGAGKSICSFQVAETLADCGYEILCLSDPRSAVTVLDSPRAGIRRLYLIDDAHLMGPQILNRLEAQAQVGCLLLSVHNATASSATQRGAISLDSERAVRMIADALRADLPRTLAAVRRADDQVGEGMMDIDLTWRIDEAERVADRPWQFCFILGGGWRRSKQAVDAARCEGADLILAAIAMLQLITRDARTTSSQIKEICSPEGIGRAAVDKGLSWLEAQRLILGLTDCRTPHQRFAAVSLKHILAGQNQEGRIQIGRMLNALLRDPQHPFAGIWTLLHELRFGSDGYSWKRLIDQDVVRSLALRCWRAEQAQRDHAAMTISELWDFAEGGATSLVKAHTSTLAEWISDPAKCANGLGYLLNNLSQQDRQTAQVALAASDPKGFAAAFSAVTVATAPGLAKLMRSVGAVDLDSWNDEMRSALNRRSLLKFAASPDLSDKGYLFAAFCASMVWRDETLSLDLAEKFIPSAKSILGKDPIRGFAQLSHDLAMDVLRIFDPLKVFVGKLKPCKRRWSIAQRICEDLDPKAIGEQISVVPKRQSQSAAELLCFISKSAPKMRSQIVRHVDWGKLGQSIGDDWGNLPHDAEVLLGTLYSYPGAPQLIQSLVADHAEAINKFSPRVMCMAPELGIAHLERGGILRLAQFQHVNWLFGGFSLALIAESRPDLLENALREFVDDIADAISKPNCSFMRDAEDFMQILLEMAPGARENVLSKIVPEVAELGLADGLRKKAKFAQTAALIIETALQHTGAVQEMAQRLRKRFPKSSVPATGDEN